MGRNFNIRIAAFVCVVSGLAAASAIRLSGQTITGRFEPETSFQLSNKNELSPEPEPVSPSPPTRTSFMATWSRVNGAKGYMLDVSTNSSFTTFLDDYRGL